MTLLDFHYHDDGRSVSFARHVVIHVEAHASGDGTLVRLEPAERGIEMHLREPYPDVMTELRLSEIDRTLRDLAKDDEPLPFA